MVEATVTASDFRRKFPEIVERIQAGESLVAISRSRPVFRVVPLQAETQPSDWLAKLRRAPSRGEPSMEEINGIVHKLRLAKFRRRLR